MPRKKVLRKSHLTSGRSAKRGRWGAKAPVCWRWPEKGLILFVDKTRDNKYAVYHVGEIYLIDRGQRKTRFTPLVPLELSGLMQMELDDFAKEQGYEKCRKSAYDSIQAALKTGEQQ